MSNKTAFISYRIDDGTDFPSYLYEYLNNHGIDTFLDQERMGNHQPVRDNCVIEASIRENFLFLFSANSLSRLEACIQAGSLDTDYVYAELESAIHSLNNIIPICIDAGANLLPRLKALFKNCFQKSDSYLPVFWEAGEDQQDLAKKILPRIEHRAPVQHVDLSNLYWVGTRKSDLPQVPDGCGFKGGIYLFGQGADARNLIMCDESLARRVDHNDPSDTDQDDFIIDGIRQVLDRDPDAKFMFYNPSTVHRLDLAGRFGRERFVCLNDSAILSTINNKRSFRELVKDVVPLLPVIERTRTDCNYEDLLHEMKKGSFQDREDRYAAFIDDPAGIPPIRYDDDLRFVVQAPVASGGSGTFILTKDNAKYLLSSLDKKASYLVSVYHTNNIPVNLHAIIFDDYIAYSCGSIQIERIVDTENKLLYKGADFPAYRKIDFKLRQQFRRQAEKVAEKLQGLGYRGVCGIDAIIHDGRVNILEVNGRFQASTELINRTLLLQGRKTVQELNLEAFRHCSGFAASSISDLYVPFSNITFSYEGNVPHDTWVYQKAVALKEGKRQASERIMLELQPDGFRPDADRAFCAQAYLYRLAFDRSIVSVSADGAVQMNENICGTDQWFDKQIRSRDKLTVKLALMILGINIDLPIRRTLREATNNAVDLQIGSGKDLMVINAPTDIRYVEFSPFSLKRSAGCPDRFSIYYYSDLLIDGVGVFREDRRQAQRLSDGKHSYSEIAYLSTDRLRIHLTNRCCFKPDSSCHFCNIAINENPNPITDADIREVVHSYIQDKKAAEAEGDGKAVTLRHFLIGGQSLDGGDSRLVAAARALQQENAFYNMPVYAMTLPLSNDTISELIDCGVYEFAYNIEIFNEDCRRRYMPGKSRCSVDRYIERLKATRDLLLYKGVRARDFAVRSMIIVGLEPYQDMIDGISRLIENRIEPLLSVFRPLPGTELADMNAPSVRQVYDLFCRVSRMLYRASKSKTDFKRLGPRCVCCQNNTVSLPWDIQKGEVKPIWNIDPEMQLFKENYDES